MVQGILKVSDENELDQNIMKSHIAYTQKAMDAGKILVSGLKADMSGALFLIKCESRQQLDDYLYNEPFHLADIQDYKVVEFQPHYTHPSPNDWMEN